MQQEEPASGDHNHVPMTEVSVQANSEGISSTSGSSSTTTMMKKPKARELALLPNNSSSSSPSSMPFYGRTQELKQLQTALETSQVEESQMIWISGPPRSGKSRLMQQFVEQQQEEARDILHLDVSFGLGLRKSAPLPSNTSSSASGSGFSTSNDTLTAASEASPGPQQQQDVWLQPLCQALHQLFAKCIQDRQQEDIFVQALSRRRWTVQVFDLAQRVASLREILRDGGFRPQMSWEEDEDESIASASVSIAKENVLIGTIAKVLQALLEVSADSLLVITLDGCEALSQDGWMQGYLPLLQNLPFVRAMVLFGHLAPIIPSHNTTSIGDGEGGVASPYEMIPPSVRRQVQRLREMYPLQELPLAPLDLAELIPLVADVVQRPQEDTHLLAHYVHQQAKAQSSPDNILVHALQVLQDMHEQRQIYFVSSSQQWEWNLDELQIPAATRALTAVRQPDQESVLPTVPQFSTLSPAAQWAMGTAAYLQAPPASFERAVLHAALQRLSNDQLPSPETMEPASLWRASSSETTSSWKNLSPNERLNICLESAVAAGVLENTLGSEDYNFTCEEAHQQAVGFFQMQVNRVALERNLIEFLISLGDDPAWALQRSADLILDFVAENELDRTQRQQFLKRLGEAGEKAMDASAFIPASQYLETALTLTSITIWKDHYDVALRLYLNAADCFIRLGKVNRGMELCRAVEVDARSNMDRLLPAALIAAAQGRQGKHQESLQTSLDALWLVNAFPRKRYQVQVMTSFTKIRRQINRITDMDFMLLPILEDKTKISILDHLCNICMRAFLVRESSIAACAALRIVEISLKDGLCLPTVYGLAAYGRFLLGTHGHVEEARRMSALAKQLLQDRSSIENPKPSQLTCVAFFTMTHYVDSWDSLTVVENLQRAHKIGMESGNLEWGYRCWANGLMHAYCASYPLKPLLKRASNIEDQLDEYQVESIVEASTLRSLVLALTDESRMYFDRRDKQAVSVTPKGNMYSLQAWSCWRDLQIDYLFGDLFNAHEKTKALNELLVKDCDSLLTTDYLFYSCLNCVALSRETKDNSYTRRAETFAKDLDSLVRKRGSKNKHKSLLVQAELASLSKKTDKRTLGKQYDRAIQAATDSSYRQDAALGNELAGECFFRDGLGGGEELAYYFSRADHLYRSWGASAKATQLRSKHKHYIELAVDKVSSSNNSETKSAASDASPSWHKFLDLSNLYGRRPFTKSSISSSTEIVDDNSVYSEAIPDHVSSLTAPTGLTSGGRAKRRPFAGNHFAFFFPGSVPDDQ